MTTMGTERSKALHNFTLPCSLRWGNQQRLLPCTAAAAQHRRRTTRGRDQNNPSSPSSSDYHFLHGSNNDDGIAAVREEVMLEIRSAANEMKDAIFNKDGRPMRTRRAASRTPTRNGGAGGGFSGTAVAAAVVEKSMKVRNGGVDGAMGSGEKKVKFSVALSKREIEEDFLGVFGLRPPRRPKKRAKIVQKELDTLFPGLWLTEVTPDKYKVPETIP